MKEIFPSWFNGLTSVGCHENIVGYYSSWFENEQLYIQMELCDCSLSVNRSSKSLTEGEALQVLFQVNIFRGPYKTQSFI
jgi:serine/threonine protein kinase